MIEITCVCSQGCAAGSTGWCMRISKLSWCGLTTNSMMTVMMMLMMRADYYDCGEIADNADNGDGWLL